MTPNKLLLVILALNGCFPGQGQLLAGDSLASEDVQTLKKKISGVRAPGTDNGLDPISVVDEVFASRNLELIAQCFEHPVTRAFILDKVISVSPSEWKNQLILIVLYGSAKSWMDEEASFSMHPVQATRIELVHHWIDAVVPKDVFANGALTTRKGRLRVAAAFEKATGARLPADVIAVGADGSVAQSHRDGAGMNPNWGAPSANGDTERGSDDVVTPAAKTRKPLWAVALASLAALGTGIIWWKTRVHRRT